MGPLETSASPPPFLHTPSHALLISSTIPSTEPHDDDHQHHLHHPPRASLSSSTSEDMELGSFSASDGAHDGTNDDDDDDDDDDDYYSSSSLSNADDDDDDETSTLHKQKKRRRRRSKQERRGSHFSSMRASQELTLADRVVMDPPSLVLEPIESGELAISKEERRIADAKVARSIAINACFIGLWYLFSLLISIYNKWMFSPEHLNFKFPLFVTCGHMLIQFLLSSLVLFAFPHFRPGNFSGPNKHHHHHAQDRNTERHRQQSGEMTKWFYITRIGPCGAATGLDIGLGNMSLKFISLAFYTMCKSSSLAFVLIFAFLFRLERPTLVLVAIISIMTIGVIMMVASESKFVLIGFLLVLTASALSGLRWALTQVLLVRNPATSNPFSTIFFLAPVMFLSILCVAVPVEGFGPLFARYAELVHEWGVAGATGVLVFPGIIAFLMVSSEFALLQRSSVVTLSICGIFKEVMTITAAAIVFKDPLTPINISGLAITIVSIGGYNWWKIQRMRREAVEEIQGGCGDHDAPDGNADGDVAYAAVRVEDDDALRPPRLDLEADADADGEEAEDDEEEDAERRRRRRKAKAKAKDTKKRRRKTEAHLLKKLDDVHVPEYAGPGASSGVPTATRKKHMTAESEEDEEFRKDIEREELL